MLEIYARREAIARNPEYEAMDENALITFLENLTPTDFNRIVSRMSGVEGYLPVNGSHLERVAALVNYVRSAPGSGIDRLASLVTNLFPRNLLPPLMITESERKSLVYETFGDASIRDQIDLTGAPDAFVGNLLDTLDRIISTPNRANAIWTLLMSVYHRVGLEHKDLIESLRPIINPVITRDNLEPVGGAVPLRSPFYIRRQVDEDLESALKRKDGIILIRGARQMGKTSLLHRGLYWARQEQMRRVMMDLQQFNQGPVRHIITDLQRFDEADLTDANTFYELLAERFFEELKLQEHPEKNWRSNRRGKRNFEVYLRDTVLQNDNRPLVWAMDEADRLFTCSFGSDFFAWLRAIFNERACGDESPWSRLVIVISYATEPHLFIRDLNQSPFNVGTRITLYDFTSEQIAELNLRYSAPLKNDEERIRFYNLTGGHPYLAQRGLHYLVANEAGFDTLDACADYGDSVFGDHLRRLRFTLEQDSDLKAALARFVCDRKLLNREDFERLQSGGILAAGLMDSQCLRNQVYERYLSRHLCQEELNQTEPR